jgi:BMFP domain-containing protein YqiC
MNEEFDTGMNALPDKERIAQLEAKIRDLEERIKALESA